MDCYFYFLCKNEAKQKHHIKYFPEFTIPVCEECHRMIHRNPGQFRKYLKYRPGDAKYFYEQKIRLRKWGIYL